MNKIARSNRRKAVPSVQLGHDRAWQRRGGSKGRAFKRPSLGQTASSQRLVERLEAENAKLRDTVMKLVLRIQALRDALGHPQSEIQPKSIESRHLIADYAVRVGRSAF